MNAAVSQEFRKYTRNSNNLKRILEDTHKALDDIKNNLILQKDIKEQLIHQESIPISGSILDCSPSFVVFGQNCHAKAIFINKILNQNILPLHSSTWRWVKQLKFSFGHVKETRLMLGYEFEIVEKVHTNDRSWITVPESDLIRSDQDLSSDHRPVLEIKLNNLFLRDSVNISVPPDYSYENYSDFIIKNCENGLPILLYILSEDSLSEINIQEIRKIKDIYEDAPILFINFFHPDISQSLTESEQHLLEQKCKEENYEGKISSDKNYYLRNQLMRLGFLNENENPQINESPMRKILCIECSVDNYLISDEEINDKFVIFIKSVLKSHLLKMAYILSKIHNNFIRSFILTAFDMAREIQITPRRISYAQQAEGELYKILIKIAAEKQEEIARIIQVTLQDMKANVPEVIEEFNQKNSTFKNSAKMATMEIQQLVLKKLSKSVANQLVQSVGCLQESFTGTLQRCLENLEKKCIEQDGNLLASDAVKQIITAAYNIELKSSSSFSVIFSFMDRLRKFLQNFQMPWSSYSQPQFNFQWQLQVATDMIDSLSASRLAKSISSQFQEHVKSSHNAFHSAMRSLENQLSGKLERTEEQRIAIRKHYAPTFARLALYSTSLCDCVLYGMPKQTREIGRGQYGVVYSCEPWGGVNPCAVKSVVPPDDRHWNDLAMEFYYTRTIPEHPRIVRLRGSVIDLQYGGGCSPAVLLVMERMTKDLYCGLRNGLSWAKRLQIAIDVVEAIRYLHSQGLVHRDIKLKNVLLDNEDRAKLTDFGFCIPEAMMSGSIVGTPVHMAPELLSGQYDSSVDVYAFGVLFWYICANQVRLPCVFEQFQNKEQLWSSVRKGVRPECLPHFTEECWYLMEQCWAAEPSQRPLLGYVQPQLEAIRDSSLNADSTDPGN